MSLMGHRETVPVEREDKILFGNFQTVGTEDNEPGKIKYNRLIKNFHSLKFFDKWIV